MKKLLLTASMAIALFSTGASQISHAEQVSQTTIYCSSIITENCTPKGRGGSNPLVVEQLRQETYRMRALAAEQQSSTTQQHSTIKVDTTSTKPTPTIMPYPDDFLTIGEVEAQELETKVIESLSEKYETIVSEGFETQFTDIESSEEKESIVILEAMNIVSGEPESQFNPDEPINRVEAVKIITLVHGHTPNPESTTSSYTDIPDNHWSVPYLESALSAEIINPIGAIEPETSVTPEEALSIYEWTTDIEWERLQNFVSFSKDSESISRAEFSELSLAVMEILWREDDNYTGPAEQLTSDQYSAYTGEHPNRSEIFPNLFPSE